MSEETVSQDAQQDVSQETAAQTTPQETIEPVKYYKLQAEVEQLRRKVAAHTYEPPPADAHEEQQKHFNRKWGIPDSSEDYNGEVLPKDLSHKLRLTKQQEEELTAIIKDAGQLRAKQAQEADLEKVKTKHGEDMYNKAKELYKQFEKEPTLRDEKYVEFIASQLAPKPAPEVTATGTDANKMLPERTPTSREEACEQIRQLQKDRQNMSDAAIQEVWRKIHSFVEESKRPQYR
jgi:hypothetical protein